MALINRLAQGIARWVGLAGGVVLLGLVLLTIVDVVLRYVFNAPIVGGQDIAQMGLLALVATAIAYGGATNAHISVDFLGKAPPSITRWTDLLVKLFSIVLLALLVRRTIEKGLDALQYGDSTIQLQIPFWPFYFLLTIGFALYMLILIGEIGALFGFGASQDDPAAAGEGR